MMAKTKHPAFLNVSAETNAVATVLKSSTHNNSRNMVTSKYIPLFCRCLSLHAVDGSIYQEYPELFVLDDEMGCDSRDKYRKFA